MLFGPFGLGWLGRVDLVSDLGAIGILSLMFLAGLGFNLLRSATRSPSRAIAYFSSHTGMRSSLTRNGADAERAAYK